MISRRLLTIVIGALMAGALPVAGSAQEFPNKEIRLVVGYPPGGSTDLLARIVAESLSKTIGQRVIVENQAGANSAIATRAVARAAKDGYTLLFNATHMGANVYSMKEAGYTWADFAPVGGVAYTPWVIIVNTASSKAKTLQDFIAFGRANPGKLTYATNGSHSVNNLMAHRLNESAKLGWREVPYKGAPQAMQDLQGGSIDAFFGVPITGIGIKGSPNIAILAISDQVRSPDLPDTPTFKELGYTSLNDLATYGIWAPAGTPAPVLKKLRDAVAEARKPGQFTTDLKKLGMDVYQRNVEEFDVEIRAAGDIYGSDFKKLGIEPE
jgi:tripartite-type tricarboxylate transporter receptor subunit TctC